MEPDRDATVRRAVDGAAPALKSGSEAADMTIMGKPGGFVARAVGDAVQERRRLEGR
jgi:hypothetical protein